MPTLEYDPVKDFSPIAGVMSIDMGVAVGPGTAGGDFSQ